MNDTLVWTILTGLLISFTVNVYLIGLHNGRGSHSQRLFDSYSKLYDEWNNALNKAKNDDNKDKQLECLNKIAAIQEMITIYLGTEDDDGVHKQNRKL